jgi:hypothetical protein
MTSFPGHSRITKFLTDRVNSFDGEASKHRLNQRPQNPALQSAAKVKEKVSILKKQNKAEGIDISVQLWIYPESKSGAAKKVRAYSQFSSSAKNPDIVSRPNCRRFLLTSTVVEVLIICLTKYFKRFRLRMTAALRTLLRSHPTLNQALNGPFDIF